MSVFNRDLVVQLLNKILGKADLAIGKTDEVLGDTKKILTAVSGGIGVVKSVQRGTARFTAKVLEVSENKPWKLQINWDLTVRIKEINPSKTIVLINGGALTDADVNEPTLVSLPYVSQLLSNQINFKPSGDNIPAGEYVWPFFERINAKVGDTVRSNTSFDWQVIEFY